MGNCYERQVEVLRRSKLSEAAKAPLIAKYNNDAVEAYDRILTQYPLEDRADDARKKLQAMGKPIPKASPEAIAQNKKEQESRGSLGTYGRMMLNFKKGPDVSQAATVGEPTLVDPKQTSAPEIVRSASATMMQALNAATNATAPAAGAPAASNANANAPKTGMFRLTPARAVAECVWNVYGSDKLHWYVPPELGRIDVLKALASGARACLIGRAWAFALGAAGEAGVFHMLQILRQELRVAMARKAE